MDMLTNELNILRQLNSPHLINAVSSLHLVPARRRALRLVAVAVAVAVEFFTCRAPRRVVARRIVAPTSNLP